MAKTAIAQEINSTFICWNQLTLKTPRMKKAYLILLLLLSFLEEVNSFTIIAPTDLNLKNCETYTLIWSKHNSNTDRYDVSIYLNGFWDPDNDGIPEASPTDPVYYAEIEEESWYGALDRKYNFTIGKSWTGALYVKIVARRRANGNWKQQEYTHKAYTIVSPLIPPPAPTAHFFCEKGNQTIIRNPTKPGNTLNWYNSIDATTAFHTGLSYSQYFTEGLTTFYLSEVNNTGGCGLESLRMPVAVYVFPQTVGVPEKFVLIQPEPDNRLGESDCSRPSTFYDLEAAVNILPIDLHLENEVIPGVLPSFTIQVSDWKDKPYGNALNPYRVCNSHLPAGNFTKRTFTRDVNVEVTIELKDPVSGETIARNSQSCARPEFMKVTVQKDNVCQSNYTDARSIYKDEVLNCSHSEDVTLCPNTNQQIGPVALYQNDISSTYEFSWTPTNGMSFSNQKNPLITYNNIILPSGQRYIKYTCTVTRKSNVFPFGVLSQEHYCVYVYLCPDCAGDEDGFQSRISEDNMTLLIDGVSPLSLQVYPNPATNQISVEMAGASNTNGLFTMKNAMGVIVLQREVSVATSPVLVEISFLPAGLYYCSVLTDEKNLLTSKLIINNSY